MGRDFSADVGYTPDLDLKGKIHPKLEANHVMSILLYITVLNNSLLNSRLSHSETILELLHTVYNSQLSV